jgi:hypothetical protein
LIFGFFVGVLFCVLIFLNCSIANTSFAESDDSTKFLCHSSDTFKNSARTGVIAHVGRCTNNIVTQVTMASTNFTLLEFDRAERFSKTLSVTFGVTESDLERWALGGFNFGTENGSDDNRRDASGANGLSASVEGVDEFSDVGVDHRFLTSSSVSDGEVGEVLHDTVASRKNETVIILHVDFFKGNARTASDTSGFSSDVARFADGGSALVVVNNVELLAVGSTIGNVEVLLLESDHCGNRLGDFRAVIDTTAREANKCLVMRWRRSWLIGLDPRMRFFVNRRNSTRQKAARTTEHCCLFLLKRKRETHFFFIC